MYAQQSSKPKNHEVLLDNPWTILWIAIPLSIQTVEAWRLLTD